MRRSETQLSKWGSSVAVRIPKPLLEAAQLREGDSVALEVEGGAIIIQAAVARPSLAELVEAIRPGNRHPETDWGKPSGNEAW
jgi:antitoxin MazE